MISKDITCLRHRMITKDIEWTSNDIQRHHMTQDIEWTSNDIQRHHMTKDNK